MIKNPQNFNNTQLRNTLNKNNIEQHMISYVDLEKELENELKGHSLRTPQISTEGKGLMKSNLSILNKFKYR
jgi:hypothetical protein